MNNSNRTIGGIIRLSRVGSARTVRLISALAGTLLLGASQPAALAANLYFSTAGGTSWDASTTADWAPVSGGSYNQMWMSGSNAVFEGTAGTVTVSGTDIPVCGGIKPTVTGYTLSGGQINWVNNSQMSASSSSITLNIGSVIADNGSASTVKAIAVSSTDHFQLNGLNTFTGPFILDLCAVDFNSLDIGGNPSSFGQGANTVAIQFGGGGNDSYGSTINYTGFNAASTDRPFVINTMGTANINNNGYGAISFNNPGLVAIGTPKPRSLALGGTFTGSVNTFAGCINDLGTDTNVTKLTINACTWNVLGTNTYSGGTVLAGGTLQITNDIALGSPTNGITFTGGTLAAFNNGAPDNTPVTVSSSRTITVNSGKTANFKTPDTNNLIVAAYITGAGYVNRSSTSYSLGTVRFGNDTNDFTGTFTVGYGNTEFTSVANSGTPSSLGAGITNSGNIVLGNGNSAGNLRYVGANNDSTTRQLDWQGTTGGYTLDVTSTGTIAYLSTATLKSGSGSANLILQGSNTGTNTLNQIINDNGGTTSLKKAGSGQWLVGNANTFSGTTTIQQGTLTVYSLNSVNGGTPLLASSSLGAPTTVADGTIGFGLTFRTGKLNYAGTGETSDRVLDLAGTTGGATLIQSGSGLLKFTSDLTASGAGSKTLTLDGSTTGTGELAGIIPDSSGGATALTKIGTGTWTLSGANTYSGNTTINAGTLALTGSGLLGTSTNISLLGNATLDVSGVAGGTYLLGASQTLWLTNGLTATNNGNLNVGSAGVVIGYSSGMPAINITGGALTLSASTPLTVVVTNGGTLLPGGTYTLISKGSGGSVNGVLPSSIVLAGDVTNTAVVSISGGELVMTVPTSTLYPPVLGGLTSVGGQVVLGFSGTNGQSYTILSSTNLSTSLTNWEVVNSGTLTGSPMTYTNGPATKAQQFFIIKSP